MSRFEGQAKDEYGRPQAGVEVYIYGQDGTEAVVTDALGAPLAQPLETDVDGLFEFYGDEAYYRADYYVGGRVVFREAFGVSETLPTAAVASVNGRSGAVLLTKADVGLANVDNTSDAAKVASGPIQAALSDKAPVIHSHDATQVILSATGRLLGRASAGAGAAEELTAAQFTSMLALATGLAQGAMSAADKKKLDNFTWSYIENLPNVTTGVATVAQRNANVTAINAALAAGTILFIRPGTRIEISSSLLFGSGSGIIGDRHGPKAVIYMPAAHFTRADQSLGTRYGTNAVGVAIHGQFSSPYTALTDVVLMNVKVESQVADNRSIMAVSAVNVINLVIDNLEITGLPLGIGLNMQSVRRSRVSNLYVHDFYTDTSLPALTTGAPNTTGLSIGGDEVNGLPCEDISFEKLRLININCGPNFQLANSGGTSSTRANQADGINVSGKGDAVSNCRFDDVYIENTGEGIDCFGNNNQFNNVRIKNVTIFGVKCIYGASRNTFTNLSIENFGLVGVEFAAGPPANTTGNLIVGLTIKGVHPGNIWDISDRRAVRFGEGATKAVGNYIVGAIIDLEGNGAHGWWDSTTGPVGNYGDAIDIRGTTAERYLILYNTNSGVREVGASTYGRKAPSTAPQAIEGTRVLAADQTTTSTALADLTGLTFTPDAYCNYEVEWCLLASAGTNTADPPRPAAAWAAGALGAVRWEYPANASAGGATLHGAMTGGAGSLQVPTATLPATNTAYAYSGRGSFRVGATPGAFKLQLAAALTGASVTVKEGSWLKFRKIT